MTHKVKSGETLLRIAQANGITLAQLLDANPQFKTHPNAINVGDEVTIPGNTEPEPVETSPGPTIGTRSRPAAAGRTLGKLSERFETSGRGPGTVSGGEGDPGGPSYGSYQMTSKPGGGTAKRFVRQPGFAFVENFRDLDPGTPAFTAAWKNLAATHAEAFQESQHAFIKKTHFDPLVNKIKTENGLDVESRSGTLQDAVWSTSVQHGSGSSIVGAAIGAVRVTREDAGFDGALISAIYAERGRKGSNGILVHFPRASPAVQRGVANRFKEEEKLALKMLREELGG
ncbi:MAG: LysM peptidoglycan-binding domain-containing protein [Acidobacteriota bacterium]